MALSGPLAGGGRQSRLALQMWVEDINSRGGLLGRKIELITYDDQGSPAQSPGIFSKLIDLDQVDLLIAPYGTVPAAAVMPMMKERQRLLIEFADILIERRVRAPLEDEELRIADAAPQSIRKTRRRQLIVAPERDLRRRSDSPEVCFHVVSENGLRLFDEVRH